MPIQILELIVKITVEQEQTGKAASAPRKRMAEQQKVVRECVKEVLRRLAQEKER